MMDNRPTVSIVIVALNCAENIAVCLEHIRRQAYPQELLEILVVDGGSTDGTQDVARSYGAKVIDGGYRNNSEPRRAIGLLNAKNEIICYIESDIFLPTEAWLDEMISPLMEDQVIVATQSLRYEHRRSDRILNRYFALMGVHDPIAYYLRKRDKLSWADTRWTLFGEAKDVGPYYMTKFDTANLPPLGCNGFVARRRELLDLTLPDVSKVPFYTHSDSVYDLVASGRDTLGFVKNTVIHVPCNDSIWKYLGRRVFYTSTLHFREEPRKYKVYDPKNIRDDLNLLKYVIYSLTVVKPLYDSTRGFIKRRDPAWFIHPVVCLLMMVSYSFLTVKQGFRAVFARRA